MAILPADQCKLQPGDKRNKWTVLGRCFRVSSGNQPRVLCVAQCECGTVSVTSVNHVAAGRSRNCGCVRKTTLPASVKTHGESKTALYRVWKGMRERCEYDKHSGYRNYGGAGIRVCDEWRNSFEAFKEWAIANGWRKRLQVDREDTNGDYCPENCRIVTPIVNCNNKRKHRFYVAWGESKTIWQWTQDQRCQVTANQLRGRLKQGWSVEEAISTPRVFEHHGRFCTTITAFGETKRLAEWMKDPRCLASRPTVMRRIVKLGWTPEEAIATPNTRRKAVAS